MNEVLKEDCRFFLGDRPCVPHKQHGVHCVDCRYYEKTGEKVLIIKLGAAGDVIRTTPLLHRLKEEFPNSYITWLTDYPDLLPNLVDEKVKFSERTTHWLMLRTFDICINLDKDREAIAIAATTNALRKFGFGMSRFGKAEPFDERAKDKFVTGVFDDVSRKNTKSYPQEIFEICGYDFRGEKYVLEDRSNRTWDVGHDRPIIGLNTGCGARWPSRLWPESCWAELGRKLLDAGLDVIWLGGPDEDSRNQSLRASVGGHYFGVHSLVDYVGLVNVCDVVVTQVTMTLHIALALEKHVVLLNNIFNKNEFELYGLGTVIEPEVPCGCYYSPTCPHESMRRIMVSSVYEETMQFVSSARLESWHRKTSADMRDHR